MHNDSQPEIQYRQDMLPHNLEDPSHDSSVWNNIYQRSGSKQMTIIAGGIIVAPVAWDNILKKRVGLYMLLMQT